MKKPIFQVQIWDDAFDRAAEADALKSFEWKASIEMDHSDLHRGKLSGSLFKPFPEGHNTVEFDDLEIDKWGYLVKFTVNVYTKQSSSYDLLTSTTTPVSVLPKEVQDNYASMVDRLMTLKFDGSLTSVVNQERFKIRLLNQMAERYPTFLWEDATLRSGSIFADIAVRGKAEEFNATAEALVDDAKEGEVLEVDGNYYGMKVSGGGFASGVGISEQL